MGWNEIQPDLWKPDFILVQISGFMIGKTLLKVQKKISKKNLNRK
jgi:hypothetical protein